ncbi:hypothetical protein [Zobellella aerophila]|uniref:Uncharacterized protein n=1 Tax=Zobellella aerophila TaxID=870480 RepID=A0ABP6VS85_9GAMM
MSKIPSISFFIFLFITLSGSAYPPNFDTPETINPNCRWAGVWSYNGLSEGGLINKDYNLSGIMKIRVSKNKGTVESDDSWMSEDWDFNITGNTAKGSSSNENYSLEMIQDGRRVLILRKWFFNIEHAYFLATKISGESCSA